MTYIGDFLAYFFFCVKFFCNIQQKEAFIEIEKHFNKKKTQKKKKFYEILLKVRNQ